MKITKTQLKKIIKEELGRVLNEDEQTDIAEYQAIANAARERVKQIDVHPYFTEYPNAMTSDRFRYAVAVKIVHHWMYNYYGILDAVGRPPKDFEGNTMSWFVSIIPDGAFDDIIKGVYKEYAENKAKGMTMYDAEDFLYSDQGVRGHVYLHKLKRASRY